MRKQLFCTGLSQSKTSYIAAQLHSSGWCSFLTHNPPQHEGRNVYHVFEEHRVFNLNQKYFSWAEKAPLKKTIKVDRNGLMEIRQLINEFNARRRWVIKDPRLIGMLPAWARFTPKAAAIIVMRDPFYIYQYRKVFQSIFKTLEEFCIFWEESYKRINLHLKQCKMPYVVVSPAYEGGSRCIKKISEFVEFSVEDGRVEVDRKDKRRNSTKLFDEMFNMLNEKAAIK